MNRPKRVESLPVDDGRTRMRHVFVRDLQLLCRLGVYRHERRKDQRVRVNLDLAVREGEGAPADRLAAVVDYEEIVERVRLIPAKGHINLIETLAERIAEVCLVDERVRTARVRVEKLDVFPDAASVGVEIERFRVG